MQPCKANSIPFNLLGDNHKLPKYIKYMLIFSRDSSSIPIEEHLDKFNIFCGIVGVEHEDVLVHFFYLNPYKISLIMVQFITPRVYLNLEDFNKFVLRNIKKQGNWYKFDQ